MSKKHEQPQATGLDLLQPEHYPAAMFAELQKFGRTNNQWRQLALSAPNQKQADLEEIAEKFTGLDLDVSQEKAYSALQLLLSRTGYKGNLPAVKVSSPDHHWEGKLPGLEFTVSEYLEAYGLEKNKRGSYPGRQRELALEALRSFCEPFRLIYRKPYWDKGEKRYHVIVVHRPLIELLEGYYGLSEEEAEAVERGDNLPGKIAVIGVRFSPLFMDGIENFFLLKPSTLHSEIEAWAAERRGSKARIPRAYSLLIQWLLTKSHIEEQVSRDTLVTKLRLESYREQRKLKKAHEQIDEALECAQELGYLLSYKEDVFGTFTLRLNPARCSRVRQPDQAKPEEEEN